MNRLRAGLVGMTALAVISDTMLLPFYPQYFAARYGMQTPEHVGVYLAALSATAMLALPAWARIARGRHLLKLLLWTQTAAGLLCVGCYAIESLTLFWLVSLAMIAFKGSYLLMYPYTMGLEPPAQHAGTIGLLAVVVHFGAIFGALLGGLVLQAMAARDVFLIMALGDAAQFAICLCLLACGTSAATGAEPPASAIEQNGHAGAIFRLCLLMLLFYASAHLVLPFFSMYWQSVTGMRSEVITGAVYAIPGGMALIALWLDRRRLNAMPAGMLPLLALGACGLLLQAAPHTAAILLGRCLYGWSWFRVTVRMDSSLYQLSRPADYAHNYSKINVAQNLGVIAASFAAGSLVQHHGLALPFLIATAGFVLTALLYPWLAKAAARPAVPPIL